MIFTVELENGVILITGTGDDGYRCGVEIHDKANGPEGKAMKAVYDWIYPKLEAMGLQIAEVPEKRGQLRKKADAAVLDTLVEVPNGQR